VTLDVVTPDRIMQLGQAFQAAKTLLSAVELGVFAALAQGPLHLQTIQKRISIHARGVRDFLDALVALRMLIRHEDGRYSNTAETDLYLDRNKPTYIGGALEHLNVQLFEVWGSLTTALRTGMPSGGAGTTGRFPALYSDPITLKIFASGMTARTRPVALALAEKFSWTHHKTFIDVGAAEGCLPVQIAQAYPHLAGGGFDLPAMAPHFESFVRAHSLSERLQFYAGDFFDEPLPSADVLIFGRVLLTWDLSTKMMLLKKAYDALPSAGALIVYERLIDDERRANVDGLLSSLNMLLVSARGFNFTGSDCKEWMHNSGFRDIYIEPLAVGQSMVVGIK
jgi:hypothetical protein